MFVISYNNLISNIFITLWNKSMAENENAEDSYTQDEVEDIENSEEDQATDDEPIESELLP